METGPDFREEHVLESGEKIVLRHIMPSDADELRRQFLALSPESRYRRFFGGITDLDAAALKYLTEVDGKDHVAIVAVIESLDLISERGVGVARFVRDKDEHTVAEVAVTVVDDMQQKGVGTLLTKALARAARERGIQKLRCEVLESNTTVVDALREAGGVQIDRSAGTVVLDVPLKESFEAFVRRGLRIAAEHMPAFIRRLLPPASPKPA